MTVLVIVITLMGIVVDHFIVDHTWDVLQLYLWMVGDHPEDGV